MTVSCRPDSFFTVSPRFPDVVSHSVLVRDFDLVNRVLTSRIPINSVSVN